MLKLAVRGQSGSRHAFTLPWVLQLSVGVDFLHIVIMEQGSLTAEDILTAVRPRFESAEAALAWYQSYPLPGFGGRTAMQLVDDGYGSAVLEYIAAVDAGIYA